MTNPGYKEGCGQRSDSKYRKGLGSRGRSLGFRPRSSSFALGREGVMGMSGK